jgi:hypothetical protein
MVFPWYRVAESVIHDDFLGAAEIYAGAGDVTGEAYARLRAAEQLVD